MASEPTDATVEAACRALAAEHYATRFGKAKDDPHVTANVDANWFVYERQVRIVLATLLSSQEAEIERLRAALRPFAMLFDAMAQNGKSDDKEVWGYNKATLYRRDFHEARAALTPETLPEPPK